MNKQVGKVVDEILDTYPEARESDLRLIEKVLEKLINTNEKTSLISAFRQLQIKHICLESITRERRRWMKNHPEIKAQVKATKYREAEEQEYYVEYSPDIDRHIPHI